MLLLFIVQNARDFIHTIENPLKMHTVPLCPACKAIYYGFVEVVESRYTEYKVSCFGDPTGTKITAIKRLRTRK